MSNLKDWLHKRRGQVFEGETLQQATDFFLKMVDGGAEVHEFKDAIIVLEHFGLPGNVRGYLLFDKFTKGTVGAMKKVTEDFSGKAIYACTADDRIVKILKSFGYTQYLQQDEEIYLVKRKE